MKKIILLFALFVVSIEAMAVRDVNTGRVENQCVADNGSDCRQVNVRKNTRINQRIRTSGDVNTGKVDNQCIADGGSNCFQDD